MTKTLVSEVTLNIRETTRKIPVTHSIKTVMVPLKFDKIVNLRVIRPIRLESKKFGIVLNVTLDGNEARGMVRNALSQIGNQDSTKHVKLGRGSEDSINYRENFINIFSIIAPSERRPIKPQINQPIGQNKISQQLEE